MIGSGIRDQRARSRVIHSFIAGLSSALFLVLAFPPFSYWGFAFLIPFPLFIVARSKRGSASVNAFWVAIGTMPAWIWTHSWISEISAAGVVPLVIQLSFFSFLFISIATKLVRRYGKAAFILPVAWVAVEFFRGSLLWSGYPWYLIAHPLIDSPLSILATPASLAGVYFVSYLTATYSYLLLQAICDKSRKERTRTGLIASALFSSWVLFGYILIPSAPDQMNSVRVGIIQPDVPQDNRMNWTVRQRVQDWLTLRDLTTQATQDPKNPTKLDMIVWPEGFVPGWTLDPESLEIERQGNVAWTLQPQHRNDAPELNGSLPPRIEATFIVDQLLNLQNSIDIPMVVGSVAFDNLRIVDTENGIEYKRDAMYNSAFVINQGQVDPVWYDKLHLTPFGEIMPLISRWDWLERQMLSFGAQGMEFVLTEGKNDTILSVPIVRSGQSSTVELATPICFEATISSVCRDLVFNNGKRQAGAMINLTNDGWFGRSDRGRKTHLLAARWRCVELNTPMVRCANTGISCLIDHRGRIINDSIVASDPNRPKEGHLIVDMTLATGITLFAFVGDLFGWICFGLVFAMSLIPMIQSKLSKSP
jgi:apolipoprotein N-acyltransferase